MPKNSASPAISKELLIDCVNKGTLTKIIIKENGPKEYFIEAELSWSNKAMLVTSPRTKKPYRVFKSLETVRQYLSECGIKRAELHLNHSQPRSYKNEAPP